MSRHMTSSVVAAWMSLHFIHRCRSMNEPSHDMLCYSSMNEPSHLMLCYSSMNEPSHDILCCSTMNEPSHDILCCSTMNELSHDMLCNSSTNDACTPQKTQKRCSTRLKQCNLCRLSRSCWTSIWHDDLLSPSSLLLPPTSPLPPSYLVSSGRCVHGPFVYCCQPDQ
jgi:hypothetical protein